MSPSGNQHCNGNVLSSSNSISSKHLCNHGFRTDSAVGKTEVHDRHIGEETPILADPRKAVHQGQGASLVQWVDSFRAGWRPGSRYRSRYITELRAYL